MSSPVIIGMKVHCNACEKEFPIGKKQQMLLGEDKPIVCKGCNSELIMSSAQKQRFLGFDNPAKYLMLVSASLGLLGVIIFGGTFLGLLRSDALVLITVAVTVGGNLVLGSKLKNATKHLMVDLDPKLPRDGEST